MLNKAGSLTNRILHLTFRLSTIDLRRIVILVAILWFSDKVLGESPGNRQVENIARARTVTVLRILDPVRRASLLRFLSQADILQLCTERKLVGIDLHETDLVVLDLSGVYFTGADLSGANLSCANLSGADLSYANLSGTDLWGANLGGAKGLTDEQQVNYQSRGARVDPISSGHPVQSTVSPATSSISRSDNNQDQSVPAMQTGDPSSSSAGSTTPPIQGEGVDGSSTSPTQSDSPH